MALPTPDPFKQCDDALWSYLEAHAGFTALVRTGNRMKSTSTRHKGRVIDADLPEVRLKPAGGPIHVGATSSSSTVTQNYRLQVATGSIKTDANRGVYPIKWQALQALAKAVMERLNLDFVTRVQLSDSAEAEDSLEEDIDNTIRGWETALDIEVLMTFRTADLIGSA